jgi:hypothetical protein
MRKHVPQLRNVYQYNVPPLLPISSLSLLPLLPPARESRCGATGVAEVGLNIRRLKSVITGYLSID